MMLLTLLLAFSSQDSTSSVDFVRDIRPILSDRCFLCHGSGEAAQEGGFRLDLRSEATSDLDGVIPIVAGDPQASELMRRVRHESSRRRMPPAKSKLELSSDEIELLERWIQEGAVYAEHWSFVAPERGALPTPRTASWVRDPIDAFVLNRMQSQELEPAPEADRASWLRRASYDLTGLPPSVAELDAFLHAQGEDVYGQELDRLLGSVRHAERMATIWLDAARYADTFGYQSDVERTVWPWRDWVVDSYASNQPYDEFLLWQIAGDLLPNATREQKLATTFNRLHRQTNEGGSTEEEYRLEYVADRVQTMSTAVMGLTMECARCHDHKFDTLTQKEFYGLSAFFDDIDESGLYSHFTRAVPTPALDLPTEEQTTRSEQLEAAVRDAERELGAIPAAGEVSIDLASDLQGLYSLDSLEPVPLAEGAAADATPAPRKEALRNDAQPEKHGLLRGEPQWVAGFRGKALQFSGDDPALFPGVGAFHRSDPFTIALRVWLPQEYERAVILHRSRAWTDSGSRGYELLIEDGCASAALIHFWPGDALRVKTAQPLPLERWVHVTLTWDGSSRAAGLKLYIDGHETETIVVRDHLQRTILGGGIQDLTLGERFRDNGFKGGRADDLTVYGRELSPAEAADLARGTSESASQPSSDDGTRRQALEKLRLARRARDEARDAVLQIMTMQASETPRDTRLLARGSYLSPGEVVQPHTPQALSAFGNDLPLNRLGLARWLVDPAHPLTARVEVNRLWQLAFGRALVSTSEDFGSQGVPPSHPQLLDELALDLIQSGWNRRMLLKRLLLSATYRQQSSASDRARAIDSDNRWLSHAPRKPLSAEMLRDGALLAAGLLVEKRGGAPAKPYQPPGLWQEKSGLTYKADEGEGLWRRSLYTFWKRTSPPPSMMILGAAKRDVCVVRRDTASSPLQALVLWNDPQYVEAARVLAARAMRESSSTNETLEFAFRSLTSRVCSEQELELLLNFQVEQRAVFAQHPDEAEALLAVGAFASDEIHDPLELAAWTVVIQIIQSFDAALSTP